MVARRLVLVVCLMAPLPATAGPAPHLVVLSPTGQTRDGLPVLTRHPGAAEVGAVLVRGFSGRLLRLYALEQEFLRRKTGRQPEPAYLLLSDRQGGFPQIGFYLDGQKKPDAGWVDLHRNSALTGRFGTVDQIFPHELLHVIVRQLAGESRVSGGNQVHALGVRTDPVTAFGEGFAEHAQVMAVDDADAAPDTARLARDDDIARRAEREFAAYARELDRRFLLVGPSQLRFLLWFSQSEQVMRYHGVKANRFARAVTVPARLLDAEDKYAAYLFQNVALPAATDPPKTPPSMLSTEGVVAHLFWRLATDAALQQRLLSEESCSAFGVEPAGIAPADHIYLKLFLTFFEGRPSTTVDFLRAYVRLFPDDARDAERVVRDALLGHDLPDAPEVWLAHDTFMTGTSLFDQFRALPRAHTFDVNAASELDWMSVPGVSRTLARQLLADAPYARLEDLTNRTGVAPDVRERLVRMQRDMAALLAASDDGAESLSLSAILRPYAWRLGAVLALTTALGAVMARAAGARRRWSATAVAVSASVLVLTLSWIVVSPAWYPAAAPVVCGGVPWALWRLARRRSYGPPLQALAVWIAATAPALFVSRVWW